MPDPHPDAGRLADAREREADEMTRRSERLGGQIEDVRQEWEHKRADDSVPGAAPPEAEDRGEAREADEGIDSDEPAASGEGADSDEGSDSGEDA